MSNTKREPLLSDADLGYVKDTHTPEQVRDIYEDARAKDAELIQRLIHEGNAMAALIEVNEPFIENDVRRSHWHSHRASWMAANDAAEAAGFKPTEP
jgi:hypothetical protein